MKKARYYQVTSEVGKLSRPFIPVERSGVHKMSCCDCGLVHNMKFTAWLRVPGGYQKLSRRAAVVMVQAGRNNKATAGRRRNKKFSHLKNLLKK